MSHASMQSLERRMLFAGDPILFIRGGSGTGGFIDGGTLAQRDEELSDINNHSTAKGNHGWGELADMLRGDGFDPQQVIEKPNHAIDLTKIDLSGYKTIVFGSNNADYTPGGDKTMVKALANYVFAGGSALFVSDGNFGSSYSDAPNSDKDFLVRFGLNVNQDFGQYSLTRATDFRQPDHPILAGVKTIDGEGVSPGVIVSHDLPGVTPQVLVNAKGTTRNNDNVSGKGTNRAVTEDDGALVVAAAGLGRVAISFDRNTFFNTNGAGTDLHHLDNAGYAKNLFDWLAGRTPPRPQVQAEDFQSDQNLHIAFNRYVGRNISVDDVKLINRKTKKKFAVKSVSFDASSNTATFTFSRTLSPGNYRATLFADGIVDTKKHLLADDVSYSFHVSGS